MSWSLEVSTEFEQDYRKLCGRNDGLRRAVDAKIASLREAPLHSKPGGPPSLASVVSTSVARSSSSSSPTSGTGR